MINFSFVVIVANIPGLRIDISPMRNQKSNNVRVPRRGGLKKIQINLNSIRLSIIETGHGNFKQSRVSIFEWVTG